MNSVEHRTYNTLPPWHQGWSMVAIRCSHYTALRRVQQAALWWEPELLESRYLFGLGQGPLSPAALPHRLMSPSPARCCRPSARPKDGGGHRGVRPPAGRGWGSPAPGDSWEGPQPGGPSAPPSPAPLPGCCCCWCGCGCRGCRGCCQGEWPWGGRGSRRVRWRRCTSWYCRRSDDWKSPPAGSGGSAAAGGAGATSCSCA